MVFKCTHEWFSWLLYDLRNDYSFGSSSECLKRSLSTFQVHKRGEHNKCTGGRSKTWECVDDCPTARANLHRLPMGYLFVAHSSRRTDFGLWWNSERRCTACLNQTAFYLLSIILKLMKRCVLVGREPYWDNTPANLYHRYKLFQAWGVE